MPRILKTVQDYLFSNHVQVCLGNLCNFADKICCNTKFLQEIALYHLVRVFKVVIHSINLGNISSIYKSFEQIHRDFPVVIYTPVPKGMIRQCGSC